MSKEFTKLKQKADRLTRDIEHIQKKLAEKESKLMAVKLQLMALGYEE